MDADHIRLREQRVEVWNIARLAGGPARVMVHQHVEGGGACCDGLADAAESDKSEAGPGEVLTQVTGDFPAAPGPAPEGFLGGRGSPAGREDQEHGDIRGRPVEHSGGIAYGHAVLPGRRYVDVVVADGDVGDDPQPAECPRDENLVVDGDTQHADDRVRISGCLAQGGGGIGEFRRLVDVKSGRLQRLEPFGGELCYHKHGGAMAASARCS